MEVRQLSNKKITLTQLFWHYLLTVGVSAMGLLALVVIWAVVMLSVGLVLPANTAERQVQVVESGLMSGALAPAEVPPYYRWACIDRGGEVTDHSLGLSARRQAQMEAAAEDGSMMASDFPYSQYHRFAPMPDGRLCVLQYDYSAPYTQPWMQQYLPEFQTLTLMLFGLALVLMIVFWTKHYARKLRGDAMALTAATKAIAEQRLDVPFENHTNVREFGELLQAMDVLRSDLSASLHQQWSMEQQRTREIAALTHDLKTPLTVISGNSELLAEEELEDGQRRSVEAILRNAQRMESCLNQLRLVVRQQEQPSRRENTALEELFAEWVTMGEELCGAKEIPLLLSEAPRCTCRLDVQGVTRAVQNLLDNAVRYTPQGGEIRLSAWVEDSQLNIVVEDGGPGFTEEALTHGCDAFFTENRSRQGAEHMGMGLYNVQCVAQRHQGTVTLSNGKTGGVVTLQLKLTE